MSSVDRTRPDAVGGAESSPRVLTGRALHVLKRRNDGWFVWRTPSITAFSRPRGTMRGLDRLRSLKGAHGA